MEITISKADWHQYHKPCVYQLLAPNGLPLYIGYSNKGYERVFRRSTPATKWDRNRIFAIGELDSVKITFFEIDKDARAHEKRLIHELHPKYNRCYQCWVTNNEKLSDRRHGIRNKPAREFSS